MRSLSLLLALGVMASPAAWAQGTPVAPAPAPDAADAPPPEAPADDALPAAPPTPGERLEEAVRLYQLGQFDEARATLAELAVEGSGLSADLQQQARIYMGELLFTEGDQDGAQVFFRKVLDEEPERVLDPVRHPPDVVGFFNYVRALVDAEARPPDRLLDPVPVAPVVVQPAPVSAWAPLGVYRFRQGQPGAGAAWLTAQVGLTGVSFVTWSLLTADNGAPTGSPELATLQRMRVVNLVSAGGAVLAFGLSVVDAQVHWRRTHPRPVRVGVAPGGAGSPAGATAALRF